MSPPAAGILVTPMLKRLTETAFLILVFSLPFDNLRLPINTTIPYQLTEPIFHFVSGLFAVSILAGRSRFAGGKIYFFAGGYLVFISLSAVFSESPGVSVVKTAGITYLAALALIAYNIVREEAALRRAVQTWLAATAIVSAFSILVLILFYFDRDLGIVRFGLSHYGTFPEGNYPRIQSLFSNPNMLAHYLGISWVLLLLAGEKGWIGRRAAQAAGGMVVVAALFTLSPGIGVLFFCTGVWMLVRKGSSLPRLIPAALIAISILFVAVTAVKFDENFSLTREPSARMVTWSSAASTFAADPLTGSGVGTGAADARYGTQKLTDAHNIFLNVAAESGVGAVLALILLGVWLTARGFRTGHPGSASQALAVAFVGAFFYQGMTGSFEDARHLWVLMGILAAAASFREGGADE